MYVRVFLFVPCTCVCCFLCPCVCCCLCPSVRVGLQICAGDGTPHNYVLYTSAKPWQEAQHDPSAWRGCGGSRRVYIPGNPFPSHNARAHTHTHTHTQSHMNPRLSRRNVDVMLVLVLILVSAGLDARLVASSSNVMLISVFISVLIRHT